MLPCLNSKVEESVDWSISSIIYNTFDLSLSFVSYEFYRVRRFLNSAIHFAAKYVVSLKIYFSCNKCNLPPPFLEASRQDR